MKKQNCRNCKYSEFQVTEKGNIRHSKPGTCHYRVNWPILPISYSNRFIEPTKSAIWIDEGEDCKCYEEK